MKQYLWLLIGLLLVVGSAGILRFGYVRRDDPRLIPYLVSALSDPGEAFFYGVLGIAGGVLVIAAWILNLVGVL